MHKDIVKLREIYLSHGASGLLEEFKKVDYGEFTLQEIGDILGITRERARQIELSAIKKLKVPPTGIKLKKYVEIGNNEDYSKVNYGKGDAL